MIDSWVLLRRLLNLLQREEFWTVGQKEKEILDKYDKYSIVTVK